MDNKLSTALEFSNYRHTLSVQLNILKTKIKNDLLYSINGGTFEITPELISFLQILHNDGKASTVILDINYIPIQLSDIHTTLQILKTTYESVTTEYLTQYNKIRQARTVSSIHEKTE